MFKSLKDWSTFAGGTSAAAGKHGYDLHLELEAITYTIQPVSSRSGRHAGYVLSRAVTGRGCLREDLVGLHGYIGPDGSEGGAAGFINWSAFRSPQAAHTAARKHWERYVKPATPGSGNGKRRSPVTGGQWVKQYTTPSGVPSAREEAQVIARAAAAVRTAAPLQPAKPWKIEVQRGGTWTAVPGAQDEHAATDLARDYSTREGRARVSFKGEVVLEFAHGRMVTSDGAAAQVKRIRRTIRGL